MKKPLIFCFFALLLFVPVLFLHFWKLGEIPYGFGIDESSIGYNAWCILETGADEYGKKLPLFFRGLDNYHDPIMVYSIVPLIKLFGLSKGIVRVPSALFFIAASILFGFLVFRYIRSKYMALFGTFIFSVLPWVFPVSRTMFAGYTPMLFGITAGWLFFMKALGKRSFLYAVLSAAGWAFAMYSHNCGRPFTAFFLTVVFIVFCRLLLRRWKTALCFVISFFTFMLPMCMAVLNNPGSMTERFSTISVWMDGAPLHVIIGRIVLRYLEYFSPQFLFMTGGSDLRLNTGGGELYIFMFPFIITGIYVVLRYFKYNPYYRIIVVGFLLFPVAAIFTMDHMHSTRSIDGIPFFCLTAFLGIQYMWRKRDKYKILLVICLLFSLYEIPSYFRYYFNEYPELAKNYFDAPLIDAIRHGFAARGKDGTFYISPYSFNEKVNSEFKPYYYAHLLYFCRIHPSVYQLKGIPPDLIRLHDGMKFPRGGIYLRKNYAILLKDGRLQPIPNPEKAPGDLILKENIAGDKFYELYKVKGE